MGVLESALSAVGAKDYAYLAIILAVGGGALWFVHHERSEGAAKIIASDAKAVAVQVQRDDALRTTAALATSIAQGNYTHEIAVPVRNAPVPVGLCHLAPDSGPVSAAAGSNSGGDAGPAGGSEDAGTTQQLQQFADAAVQIARDADAQVTALQADNAALRAEMAGK